MFSIRTHNLPPRVTQRVTDALRSPAMRKLALRSLVNMIRAHLVNLEQTKPNRKGWPRLHWYAKVARSVNQQETPRGGQVLVSHVGAALRYFGGTVKPVKKKWLTIPMIAASYGKRAREFRNLFFVQFSETKAALMRIKTRGGNPEMVYLLLKKSVVKPFKGLIPTVDEMTQEVINRVEAYLDR